MYEVTVEAGFSSGHYLRNYKGKCENPHGHNYKVRVTLAGTALERFGRIDICVILPAEDRPPPAEASRPAEAGPGVPDVG